VLVAALFCSPGALAAGALAGEPAAHSARVGHAPSAQRLRLVLPLVADDAGLRRFATAVTTIGSPQYAQYESISQLAARFGASSRTRARVVRILRAAGATAIHLDATGLFVDATISARRAERLFDTTLDDFRIAHGARFTAPSSPVAVPARLRGLITGVVGLDTKGIAGGPALAREASGGVERIDQTPPGPTSGYTPATGTRTGCAQAQATGGFTPNEYNTAYGYDPLHASGVLGQGERIALIEIDGFKATDIETFAHCFDLRLPAINGFGVGVSRPLAPGGESTLDLEVLDSVASGLRSIDVYESQADAADTLQALTAPLQNHGFKPQVISASLGLCEQFTYEAVGRAGLAAAESALEEAAASGITFLAASGDDGSADCTNNNGEPEPDLAVNYPASSDWATGVGGTNFSLSPQNTITSQVVWNDGSEDPGAAGGGGVSALFPRPAYQDGIVAVDHRAVPDVAMLADIAPGFAIYCSATPDCVNSQEPNPWETVGGTSAATPLLAGGFALVDEILREHEVQSLGLANPLLYSIGRVPTEAASVFSDVTQGSNDVGPFVPSIGQPLGCCTAVPGYDEASGWGSVNLSAFSAVALATEPKVVAVAMALPPAQHPVRSKLIKASVSCSGACDLGAFAVITIGHKRLGKLFSDLYHVTAAGTKAVEIKLPSADLKKLRTALANGDRIVAAVTGAIVDAGGNVQRQTPTVQLKIGS
jgi:subtilase family serine protease